jgi:AcrR family transcriptional regulator
LPFKPRISRASRRALIEEVAAQLFAERGFESTSLEAIAQAAGITRPVIYDHFASKAELHIALLHKQTEQLLGSVGRAVAGAPDAPETRLRAGIAAFFAFVEEHPFAWRMIFRDPPADGDIAAAHRQIQDQATAAIAGWLAAGARAAGASAGPGDERRLEAFAEMLKVAQNSLAARWWEQRELDREQLVEWVVEFAWRGLESALADQSGIALGAATQGTA